MVQLRFNDDQKIRRMDKNGLINSHLFFSIN